MKKGQKVRILSDNSIGIIADSTFFVINNKKHVRYEVRKKGETEGLWYKKEQIGSVVCKQRVKFIDENNQSLFVDLIINYDNNDMKVKLTGYPINLKEHNGAHVDMAMRFIRSLKMIS